MGTNFFKNMFLLGTLGMGSMMFGMTSCCDDEKKVQSASEVEKRLEELSNEVAKQSEIVVNKTNEYNQLVLDIENGTATKSVASTKVVLTKAQPTDDGKQNLRNKLDQLEKENEELESDIKQLDEYISGITITISGEVLNSAKDAKTKGEEVNKNAIPPIESGETYLAEPTEEHWGTLVQTAKTSMIFKVAFDSQGGSKVDTAYVKGEGKVTKPTDPTYATYTFIAWYSVKTDTLNKQFDFNGAITKDTTLYAFWKEGSSPTPTPVPEKTYNVIFDAQNGSATTTTKVKEGATVTKPTDPTLTGYSFIAWYGKQDTTEISSWNFSSDKITQDTTLYGFWKNPGTGSGNPQCEDGSTEGWF